MDRTSQDRASQVLAEGLHSDEPRTYAALAERGGVPRSTVLHRAHGRPSKEDKAQRQQYLTPVEEKALAKYSKRMSDIGYPVPIKHLSSLGSSRQARIGPRRSRSAIQSSTQEKSRR